MFCSVRGVCGVVFADLFEGEEGEGVHVVDPLQQGGQEVCGVLCSELCGILRRILCNMLLCKVLYNICCSVIMCCSDLHVLV